MRPLCLWCIGTIIVKVSLTRTVLHNSGISPLCSLRVDSHQMYLTVILQPYPYLSLALDRFRLDISLQYPRVVWRDLLIVVLKQTYFLEAVPFVEALRLFV